ncbi:MAG TPA: hypothetical protein VIT65_17325 [Microlunatus sp.]
MAGPALAGRVADLFRVVDVADGRGNSDQMSVPSLNGWWQELACPLRDASVRGDDSDLEPLAELFADARVVRLGESSHGGSELFTMKHRLIVRHGTMPPALTGKQHVNSAWRHPPRRVVLADGTELTRLMVRYDVGAAVKETYQLKSVDDDVLGRWRVAPNPAIRSRLSLSAVLRDQLSETLVRLSLEVPARNVLDRRLVSGTARATDFVCSWGAAAVGVVVWTDVGDVAGVNWAAGSWSWFGDRLGLGFCPGLSSMKQPTSTSAGG